VVGVKIRTLPFYQMIIDLDDDSKDN